MPAPPPLEETMTEHAGLTVRSVGPPATADGAPTPVLASAILCHGFGAPATDLLGLAGELLRERPGLAGKVRLHFPGGPLDLGPLGLPGGRAWWMLDQARVFMGSPAERVRHLRESHPATATAVREQFDAAVASLLAADGLTPERAVIGGFSQGAMLATDHVLRSDEEVGGLAVLSGALVAEDLWRPRAAACPKRRVFQTHGRTDQILPFATAELLRDLLTGAGHAVTFKPFPGGHTITHAAIAGVADLLQDVVES